MQILICDWPSVFEMDRMPFYDVYVFCVENIHWLLKCLISGGGR